jgi:glycosyltransferase involved in cell wall biosynthesis
MERGITQVEYIVVIPAYNPDERLLLLIDELAGLFSPTVIVVNDGSGPDSRHVFDALAGRGDVELLEHAENKGKGAALKTAAAHVLGRHPGAPGFVAADADHQHTASDILRMEQALEASPDSLVLGVRDFSGADVPGRSRWGNRLTSAVFKLQTGVACQDTQTGLRAMPTARLQEIMAVPGERFEYEMNVLLWAAKAMPIVQVPIQTVYIEGNRTSSFRVVRDSARIYWGILKYSFASLLSAALDISVFAIIVAAAGRGGSVIAAATAASRIASGACNYLLNRHWVFSGGKKKSNSTVFSYALLFCFNMAASWFLVSRFQGSGASLVLVKVCVDSVLFLVSYQVQKRLIFK